VKNEFLKLNPTSSSSLSLSITKTSKVLFQNWYEFKKAFQNMFEKIIVLEISFQVSFKKSLRSFKLKMVSK